MPHLVLPSRSFRSATSSLLISLLLCVGTPALAADWTLDNNASQLSFVSIKAGNIGEVHRFKELRGQLDKGVATLSVALASVDTLIPIRDQRMQSMLFQTDMFPTATVTVSIEESALAELTPGKMGSYSLPGQLQIKDRNIDLTAHVSVMRVAPDRLVVATRQPILLDASAVGLAAGVEKLREVAGLPSISRAVPVTFILTFTRE